MPLSHYLKVYPYAEKPGHLLLFSTKTASKVLIPEETFQSISDETLSSSDKALLSRLGMIVENTEEERKSVLGFLDGMHTQNSGLDIVVVLNLACNFSCVYCYEGDMKGDLFMSDDTADCLLDFIREKFTPEKKSLFVSFYGGEPLLSFKLIQRLASKLKPLIEGKGGKFSFTLVSNGSLFKRSVAQALVPLGLESIKITLDGPAEIHNQYRPFISGAGSFDTIIRNIQETWDLVKIAIGGNYDQNTHHRFPLLLDELIEAGLTPEKIYLIKFDPIMKQPQDEPSLPDYRGGCMSINDPWVAEAWSRLREEILSRGYPTLGISPMVCMVENPASHVVNFDGVIYKCPAFIGKKGFETGDLNGNRENNEDRYCQKLWNNETCRACKYLPLCFGGCRYSIFTLKGVIDGPDCRKNYLDSNLERLVKQDIRYNVKVGQR